jgi:hypothetical protein
LEKGSKRHIDDKVSVLSLLELKGELVVVGKVYNLSVVDSDSQQLIVAIRVCDFDKE